ncbi:MAG: BTAD domain-containing putative transcriptional regulator [Acidimicrobiales bacterium]
MSAITARSRPLYRLFGEIAASIGGGEVNLGGPKQQAVLAVLLVNPGQLVALDRIIYAVWGDYPPARAEVSVRGYVSNLRKALDTRITWRGQGYVIEASAADVDIHRFEALVAEGHAHDRAGRLADAKDSMSRALSLWTGPPFGAHDSLPVADVAARLSARRAEAIESLFAVGLALGDHDAAIADLAAAVSHEPFRERLHALLALALYRAGRPVDALRAIDTSRRLLADEVGVEPGPELRELEAAILAHDQRLAWQPPREPPARPAVSTEERLAGRSAELRVLRDALHRAAAGRGSVVVVDGEPGIGKTRLLRQLADDAHLLEFAVAWGRCPESAIAAPYFPWRAVATQLADARIAVDAEVAFERRDDREGDSAAARLAVHTEVAGCLRPARRPILIVIDDLQWADEASLSLAGFLGGEIGEISVLLAVTARPSNAESRPMLTECLSELARSPMSSRVELRGLARDTIAEWVRAAGGAPFDDAFITSIHQRTGGNPFFVRELLALVQHDSSDDTRTRIPGAVQDVVRRRTSRLPVNTQKLLLAASAIGSLFDVDILAAIVGNTAEEVLDALAPAIDAGLVAYDHERPWRFAFSHALVAETLVSEQNPILLARVHVDIVRALERLRAGRHDSILNELAHHAYAGALAGSADAAVEYSTAAAAVAASAYAFADAATHLGRALEALEIAAPDDAPRALSLLLELGSMRVAAGDIDGGRQTLVDAATRAERVGDVNTMVAALGQVSGDDLWSSIDWGQHDDRTIALLERALAQLPTTNDLARAQLLAAMSSQLYYGDPRQSVALAAEAVRRAERAGDPLTLARVLVQHYWASWRPRGNESRAATADAIIALAERGLVPERFTALGYLARFTTAYELGDANDVERFVRAARAAADPVRTPAAWTYVLYAEVSLLLLRGSFDEVERTIRDLIVSMRRTRRFAADATEAGLLAQLNCERGRADDALAVLDRFGGTAYAPSSAWLRAWILSEAGRIDEAASELASFRGPVRDDWYRLPLLTAGAHAAAAVGDRQFIDAHLEDLRMLRPFVACTGSGGIVLGPVALALARCEHVLGNADAARELGVEALATTQRLRATPWIARCERLIAQLG